MLLSPKKIWYVVSRPGGLALLLLRLQILLWRGGPLGRMLAHLTHQITFVLTGLDAVPGVTVGRRLALPHPSGVVLGGGCVIGSDVTIMSGVTIGERRLGLAEGYPRIADGVTIGTKASVLGPVEIGQGALIGAHALVTQSVAAGERRVRRDA